MLGLIRVEYFGKPSKNVPNMDLQRETPISPRLVRLTAEAGLQVRGDG